MKNMKNKKRRFAANDTDYHRKGENKMKHVKASIALLLVLAFCVAVFAGCNRKKMVQAGEVSDFSGEERFDAAALMTNRVTSGEEDAETGGEEQTSAPQESTTTVKPSPSNDEPVTGDMVVNEKKYSFREENLMLLNVENQTNKHFDVTIKGRYLDADGNVIKEETQRYTAFPSGWKNYFIFRPRMAFESFEYTLEVTDYDASDAIHCYNGEPLSSYLDMKYSKKLYFMRGADASKDRDMVMDIELVNSHPSVSLSTDCHVLVLDEQGEIYTMDYEYFDNWPDPSICYSGTGADPVGGENDGKALVALRTQPKKADETIPDNVQGKLTAIFAYCDIVDYNALRLSLGF